MYLSYCIYTCTYIVATCVCMNNQVHRALFRKEEKERKLQQPQWLRKIESVQPLRLRKIESAQPLCFRKIESVQPPWLRKIESVQHIILCVYMYVTAYTHTCTYRVAMYIYMYIHVHNIMYVHVATV